MFYDIHGKNYLRLLRGFWSVTISNRLRCNKTVEITDLLFSSVISSSFFFNRSRSWRHAMWFAFCSSLWYLPLFNIDLELLYVVRDFRSDRNLKFVKLIIIFKRSLNGQSISFNKMIIDLLKLKLLYYIDHFEFALVIFICIWFRTRIIVYFYFFIYIIIVRP